MFEEPMEPPGEEPGCPDADGSPPPPDAAASAPVFKDPGGHGEGGALAPEGADENLTEPAAGGGVDFDSFARLCESQRRWQQAGAERVVELLDAYDEAMQEFAAVFGRDADDRGGPFARSFLLEASQVLHVHERTAGILLDAAQALRRSYPRSWAVFVDGRVTWQEAELVWRQALGLDPDRIAEYDEAAAALLVRGPMSRLRDGLHRLRERLQADTAEPRHTGAMQERCVRVEPAPDGMAWLHLYGEAAELLAFDDALTKAAVAAHGLDGETRNLAQLRYDVTRDLLLDGIALPSGDHDGLRVPNRKAVQPVVYLTIPVLTALGRSTEPAVLAGYGPIDLDTAKRLAGEASGWIRILTDPVTGVRLAMDRRVYTPAPDLKRWLRVRDETCRAPGCNRRVATCDIDHVSGWVEDGRTEDGNLVHLCRHHHQLKGCGYWRTTLQADGRMRWRSWWDRLIVTEPADQPAPPTWTGASSAAAVTSEGNPSEAA